MLCEHGNTAPCVECDIGPLKAENEALQHELEMYKSAFNEWLGKTKWVQETAVPKELGMHRADVMKSRIEALQAKCEKLAEALETCLEIEERPKIIKMARAALAAHRKGGKS